jgi:hypothetical protein
MKTAMLQMGSFTARLFYGDDEYPESLAIVFGAPVRSAGNLSPDSMDADIVFYDRRTFDPHRLSRIPEDGMIQDGPRSSTAIHTEAMSAYLSLDRRPPEVIVRPTPEKMPEHHHLYHVSIVFNKILFLLDRLLLHAAAVVYKDSVSLFVGDGGAGKTTICLSIAAAGGVVLGEDRILLRRTPNGALVSGCEDRLRLTAKTEHHFFPERLPGEAREVNGVLKKEIRASAVASSTPYRDFGADRLFFCRVGAEFRIRKLSRQEAVLRLIGEVKKVQRFVSAEDQRSCLFFLSDLAERLPAYSLELSEDLHDLDKLNEFLLAAARSPELR